MPALGRRRRQQPGWQRHGSAAGPAAAEPAHIGSAQPPAGHACCCAHLGSACRAAMAARLAALAAAMAASSGVGPARRRGGRRRRCTGCGGCGGCGSGLGRGCVRLKGVTAVAAPAPRRRCCGEGLRADPSLLCSCRQHDTCTTHSMCIRASRHQRLLQHSRHARLPAGPHLRPEEHALPQLRRQRCRLAPVVQQPGNRGVHKLRRAPGSRQVVRAGAALAPGAQSAAGQLGACAAGTGQTVLHTCLS